MVSLDKTAIVWEPISREAKFITKDSTFEFYSGKKLITVTFGTITITLWTSCGNC